MKTANLIKKSIILGLSIAVIGMSGFAEEMHPTDLPTDAPSPVIENNDIITSVGTLVVKTNKKGSKIKLTKKGKKVYNVVLNDLNIKNNQSKKTDEPVHQLSYNQIFKSDFSPRLITLDDLIKLNGKVVKLTGFLDDKGKTITVIDFENITDRPSSPDAK